MHVEWRTCTYNTRTEYTQHKFQGTRNGFTHSDKMYVNVSHKRTAHGSRRVLFTRSLGCSTRLKLVWQKKNHCENGKYQCVSRLIYIIYIYVCVQYIYVPIFPRNTKHIWTYVLTLWFFFLLIYDYILIDNVVQYH